MRLVIFGLSISSSWGNGHATLWRGLCRSLSRRGHSVTFYEKDVPYYAEHRDALKPEDVRLRLYSDWRSIEEEAADLLRGVDVVIVTSYCPDAQAAEHLIMSAEPRPLAVFYDLDAPVTLDRLEKGLDVPYIGAAGLAKFDLVLSYTGGKALTELKDRLHARRVTPLYGSVDPEIHFPVRVPRGFSGLSYLGTYAEDRREALDRLFLEPARRLEDREFLLGGSLYPTDFPWAANVHYRRHVPPAEHSAFYCSARLTLNITRGAMARFGFCPSGRLFEAAACGVPIVTDDWEGLHQFFTPGEEILLARSPEEAIGAIERSDTELDRIAARARARALEEHSAERRAEELEHVLQYAARPWVPGIVERQRPSQSAPILDSASLEATGTTWGIIPAAGAGTRIQPLAFSKELLPIGTARNPGERSVESRSERPRAVSEYLVERLIIGGVNRLCFVVSPGKGDIISYYGSSYGPAPICYVVQPRPAGLCDALFRAAPLIRPGDRVLVGLPDTIWFPEEGFHFLCDQALSFLLFKVSHPEYFDAVICDEQGVVSEIQVKQPGAGTPWVWGAFKMPGRVFLELYRLWCARGRIDEYLGPLVNFYIQQGGPVRAAKAGKTYVDVGTVNGYREALQTLASGAAHSDDSAGIQDLAV